MQFFVNFSKLRRTTTGGLGAHGAPWSPKGPQGAPLGAPRRHVSGQKFDPKIKHVTKWVAVAPFGELLVQKFPDGPPGAIGTPPGPKTDKKNSCCLPGPPLGPLLGAALKGRLHWYVFLLQDGP